MNPAKSWDRIKRKRLLVLPLLTLPFITFGFWALGGGKGTAPQAEATLNHQLPGPSLREGAENKLSFYEMAAAAEKKRLEALKADPYFRDTIKGTQAFAAKEKSPFWEAGDGSQLPSLSHAEWEDGEPTEAQLLQKLERLNREIERPATFARPSPTKAVGGEGFNQSIDRLEQLMEHLQENPTEDAEMDQLATLLDRILDIQHPQRVQEKLQETQAAPKDSIFSIAVNEEWKDTGFYGLEKEPSPVRAAPAIEAVVHGTQTLVNGALVKIRLLEALRLDGVEIPAGTFVYGLAQLQDERLKISIPSIRHGLALYPVRLVAYDLDGLPGIQVPAAIAGEVTQTASQKMLQQINLPIGVPSLKTGAAAVGLDAAKNFLSRKARQTKVTVKDGYQLLLKPNH